MGYPVVSPQEPSYPQPVFPSNPAYPTVNPRS